jgi:hypothetical protein
MKIEDTKEKPKEAENTKNSPNKMQPEKKVEIPQSDLEK